MLGAFALEGCARHAVEPAVTYGSIKDDGPQAPVHRTAGATGGDRAVQRISAKPAGTAADAGPSAGATAKSTGVAASASTALPPQSSGETAAAAAGSASTPQPAGADRVAAARSATEPPTTTERLLIQGRQLFQAGKVQEARKRFIAALNGLSPEATLELARSFDTHYLSKLGLADGAPDMQRALQLYKSAVERGSEAAKADLARVEATLNVTPK